MFQAETIAFHRGSHRDQRGRSRLVSLCAIPISSFALSRSAFAFFTLHRDHSYPHRGASFRRGILMDTRERMSPSRAVPAALIEKLPFSVSILILVFSRMELCPFPSASLPPCLSVSVSLRSLSDFYQFSRKVSLFSPFGETSSPPCPHRALAPIFPYFREGRRTRRIFRKKFDTQSRFS